MKKKDLISKWLDFNLSDTELEAFNELDASDSYRKISETAQLFKAPELEVASSYNSLNTKISAQKKKKPVLRYISGITAVLVICFGVYYFIAGQSDTFKAVNGTTAKVKLPDSSEVILNDGSSISFEAGNWETDRMVSLEGEAFFKVVKGGKFTVSSAHGEVAVLGTQFSIKDRPDFFEVICYEGRVRVSIKEKQFDLNAGEGIKWYGDTILNESIAEVKPEWLANKSVFKSVPYIQVLRELERQYDINITGRPADYETLFTGTFSHENLDTALQAITIPLNLSYTIDGKNVVLKNNQQ